MFGCSFGLPLRPFFDPDGEIAPEHFGGHAWMFLRDSDSTHKRQGLRHGQRWIQATPGHPDAMGEG
jgi:hypothetical protein